MAVAPWIVSDALWARIERLLPQKKRRRRFPGRKRLPDRQALQGILFVLHTGIAWRHLPLALGLSSRCRLASRPEVRGNDNDNCRWQLRARGITPEFTGGKTEHGSGLGRVRWVVERTFAWLHKFKRLLVRYDRRHEIHQAFLALGCCLVCFRRLQNSL